MPSRRGVLRSLGTVGAGIGTISLATGPAAATHLREHPDHVTLSFERSQLEQYRPLLDISHLDVQPTALYGWRATSPEYEFDWYVYWAEYVHQAGVSSYDSHYGDHEPVYVGVKDGSVERVLYSGYHWLKATAVGDAIPTYETTHPALHVINPWHHYALDPDISGSFVEVRSLADVFQGWLDNGLAESLDPGAAVDPARMRSLPDWWRSTAAGISFNALYVRALLAVGFHGAGKVDTGRLST